MASCLIELESGLYRTPLPKAWRGRAVEWRAWCTGCQTAKGILLLLRQLEEEILIPPPETSRNSGDKVLETAPGMGGARKARRGEGAEEEEEESDDDEEEDDESGPTCPKCGLLGHLASQCGGALALLEGSSGGEEGGEGLLHEFLRC